MAVKGAVGASACSVCVVNCGINESVRRPGKQKHWLPCADCS